MVKIRGFENPHRYFNDKDCNQSNLNKIIKSISIKDYQNVSCNSIFTNGKTIDQNIEFNL